jgi:hypothetical protein
MKVQRNDRIPVKALRTDEGFLYDPNAVLTRSGIFEYRDPKTGKTTREYRPDSEVFKPDHLAAIAGLPITEGHKGKVNSANARGSVVGAVLGAGRQDGNDMVAPVKIFVTDSVDKDGFKDLSLGYDIELDETPGEINGERYDAIQRNLVPNHLAIVKRGRAGTARLNLDAADDADEIEVKPKELSNMKKVRLDNGLEYDAAPEVEVYIGKLIADVKDANAKKDAEQARADAAEAKVTGLTAEVAKARVDGVETARARLELEAIATSHKVTFKADTADKEIKVGVIKAIRGDAFDPEGRTDAYIDASYDLAIGESKERNDAAANQRRESVKGNPAVTQKKEGERNDNANAPVGAAGYRNKYREQLVTPASAAKK